MRQGTGVNELVAIDLPGVELLSAVLAAWDAGDAVIPLGTRDPSEHKQQILDAALPTRLIDRAGRHTLGSGQEVEPGDAVVIATSGTTGAPKAAVHTWEAIETAAFMTSAGAASTPDSKWLACLPLNHVGGFSVITRALITGADLEVHDQFVAEAIDGAADGGATHVSLVPAAMQRIDASRWQRILLGGAAIPADRPANSIATYGMTETFGGVVYDGLPLNGVSIRIATPPGSTDQEATRGDVGTIEISSPTLMRGYRDPGGTVSTPRWFSTADLGSLDAESGLLKVLGRSDDLINTGAEKVWPAEVERCLKGLESVADAAVVGVPDPGWGQAVAAVVVPGDERNPPSLEMLRSAVKETMPAHAAPKLLALTDEIPRTSLGKPVRHNLRELIIGGQKTEGDGND